MDRVFDELRFLFDRDDGFGGRAKVRFAGVARRGCAERGECCFDEQGELFGLELASDYEDGACGGVVVAEERLDLRSGGVFDARDIAWRAHIDARFRQEDGEGFCGESRGCVCGGDVGVGDLPALAVDFMVACDGAGVGIDEGGEIGKERLNVCGRVCGGGQVDAHGCAFVGNGGAEIGGGAQA